MKYTCGKRICAILLALCLMLSMVVPQMELKADALSVSSLTCSGFISNAIARSYIDTMMKYYINTYSKLQTALNNGKSVVFMFEGGSDNYWGGSTYADVVGDVRNQAVCIVVQRDSSGNCYIPYYCENCSSIPDDPQNCTYGVAYSGATTVKDGIHSFYTWNHTGPYGAFQLNLTEGYYTPSSALNGYTAGASGLNIHTRSTNTCGGAAAGWNWSLGCQVIGSGYYTGNEFNQFMKTVAGISYNVWLDYYNKSFNTISTGTDKGYYVVDRQLGQLATNGTKYGSGSLIALYNSTALSNISAFSTAAANAAGALDFEYSTSQCTYYPSHCQIKCTLEGAPINSQPCSVSTAYNSATLEEASLGDTYTATGLFKNHYGNYWYRITTSSGKTGYIYGGEAQYVKQIISDVKITDYTIPNGHVEGTTFYVNGTVKTTYNKLSSVACYIYSGFGISGDPVTGNSDTPSTNSYTLKGSNVDDDTWMGALDQGNYTYYISADYTNYYAEGATTLKSNTGKVDLVTDYFTVIAASTNQSTCSHAYQTITLGASNCTESGTKIQSCATCGKIVKTAIAAGSHSYGSWTTTTEATCTTSGVKTRTCSKCGGTETQTIAAGNHSFGSWITIKAATCTTTGTQRRTCTKCGHPETQTVAATGHKYNMESHRSNCTDYAINEYTCTKCGDNYKVYANEWTEWSTAVPEEGKLSESKTQYRYSDYEKKTSDSASLDGYTQINKQWIQTASGTLQYATSWPAGFETGHSVYTKYNKTPYTASETATSKVEAGTGKLAGYVFWHWCYGTYTEGPINRTTSTTNDGVHTTFHACVIDTSVDPSSLTAASDGSVTYPYAAGCTDSHWWYYFPLYEQSYTTYKAEYTYERWTDWSEWSDTPVSASDTRQVETRTVYRYLDDDLGDHVWVDGVCSACGLTCKHTFVNRVCTNCGYEKPVKNFYLFGFINGKNYGCEEDYATLGNYRFENGVLVVEFEQDSYVGIKTEDNSEWYMTDGWQGKDKTSVTLYDALTLNEGEKLFVPGKVEITFTLTENDDGTLELSYVAAPPEDPSFRIAGATLSFCDEIYYKVMYNVNNPDDVEIVEMGMVTWTSEIDGTVENAEHIIPGVEKFGSYQAVHSQGIPAKNMGDELYLKVYIKLADGRYIYSGLLHYSARTYAANKLKDTSSSNELKALCVALLNYGAAAQEYFGYNTDVFMNDDLTMRQQRLVANYSPELLDDVVAAGSKAAGLAATGGFSEASPSVNFGGAFGINYWFAPTHAVEGEMKLYVWDAAAYEAADTLTLDNASRVVTMQNIGDGKYYGRVPDVAAKNVDDTVYVCGVYESGGVTYRTGVLTYSLGAYCESLASGTGEGQYLAEATAVYCYHAKNYLIQQ